MEDTPGQLPVLKADGKGRVRVPAETRQRILEEFERSGMSGVAFAALVGVKYPTFAGWRHRHRSGVRPSAQPPAGTPRRQKIRLVEAQTPASEVALEVELRGLLRLRITHASQLALAIQLIRELGPC